MIKVGQIYKTNDRYKKKIVISGESFNGCVHFIMQDGCVQYISKTSLIQDIQNKFLELIAEYPTWQEAVNSKEFKE